MRIISNFHDYYDVVQATGQDQTLIYNRKPEEIEVRRFPFPVLRTHFLTEHDYYRRRVGKLQLQQHIIGFCGKIYPVVTLTHLDSKKSAVCYNIQEVDAFFESHFDKKTVEEYRNGESTRKRWWNKDFIPHNEYNIYFSECAAKKDAFVAMFVEKRCPVFVGAVVRLWRRTYENEGKLVYNGCLKELEFFRIFDTYSAFQEIAMFFGGMAVPVKEIPHVPDKIMAGIKGFDEWSFRKPPQKER